MGMCNLGFSDWYMMASQLFFFCVSPQHDLMAMMVSQTDSRQPNLRDSVLEVLRGDQDRLEAVEGYHCL